MNGPIASAAVFAATAPGLHRCIAKMMDTHLCLAHKVVQPPPGSPQCADRAATHRSLVPLVHRAIAPTSDFRHRRHRTASMLQH